MPLHVFIICATDFSLVRGILMKSILDVFFFLLMLGTEPMTLCTLTTELQPQRLDNSCKDNS